MWIRSLFLDDLLYIEKGFIFTLVFKILYHFYNIVLVYFVFEGVCPYSWTITMEAVILFKMRLYGDWLTGMYIYMPKYSRPNNY